MGAIISYEIQSRKKGKWRSEAIFDDRDLAQIEAKRLFQMCRPDMVRIAQENYDVLTNVAISKIIFELTDILPDQQKKAPASPVAEKKKPVEEALSSYKMKDSSVDQLFSYQARGRNEALVIWMMGGILAFGFIAFIICFIYYFMMFDSEIF